MVNINPSDVVDGKPAIVLGLIWTIILYFQVRKLMLLYENLLMVLHFDHLILSYP